MISQETINKVFALDIVEVISRHVQLKRTGANYKGFSPFTNERTPSFVVSPQKQIFKCFSSGKGGNLVKFVMEKESLTYPEAIKELCRNFSIDFIEEEVSPEVLQNSQKKESLYLINNVSNSFFKANLSYFQEALNYTYGERMLSQEIIEKFEIGFAPGTKSALTNYLVNNGYNWQLAVECGVVGHLLDKNKLYDKYRNRIMFPIKNIAGNICGFGGRTLSKDPSQAKYINSPDSIIYNKSELLYGLFESKKQMIEKNRCLLAEGYIDVIMFHQKGIDYTVAASGTALTTEQVKLIKRFTRNVTVMFDADNAGVAAALRGIDVLLAEDMNVKVLVFPQGQDPDEFARTRTTKEIENYIFENSIDFVMFKLKKLLSNAGDNALLKSEAIESVVSSISKIPSKIAQELYLTECSKLANLNLDVLNLSLKKYTVKKVEFSNVLSRSLYFTYIEYKAKIQDVCEKKILQYVLTYPTLELLFDEVLLVPAVVGGKYSYIEKSFQSKKTILEKIKFELDTDGITFMNESYLKIYNIIKTIDFKSIDVLKLYIDEELFTIANELRVEEININSNAMSFANTFAQPNDVPDLHVVLQNNVSENLLFYKIIYIEWLIEEETKKVKPDKEFLSSHYELMKRIMHQLNTI